MSDGPSRFQKVVERIVPAGTHPVPVLFAYVQAMPYRFPGPRDPIHTLEHGWGTCAGKNYLLAALLQAAGVPAVHMIATGDLAERLPNIPPELKDLAESGPLPDVHSYLTVHGPAGPVLVDASWDPPLAAHGFPVQPLPWDGTVDTVLAIRPHAVYAVTGADPSAEKDAIRARLYRGRDVDRARRDRYLAGLSSWMETLRRNA